MAVAFVRGDGNDTNKTAGTTLGGVVPAAAAVPAGNLLVRIVLFDNAATVGKPVVSGIAKAAGETNNWVLLGAIRHPSSTSAGAFAGGEMWAIKTTVSWPPLQSTTVTLDTSVTMKAAQLLEFSGAEVTLRSTVGTAYSTTTTAASAVTTGTTPVIGDLALGFLFGSNVAAAQAGDTDTTGGSWSAITAFTEVGSSGGSGATNNYGIAQYKILTAASHQTFNNSAAMTAGNGSIVAILRATPEPAITQAAYRFYADGSESGSTALGTQSTAYTADLSSGDANLGLRVRLQETGVGPVPATDDWQLQWEKNASGTWKAVESGFALLDTNPSSTFGSTTALQVGGAQDRMAQQFVGDGRPLLRARCYMHKSGTPTGDVTATLLSSSGAIGTGVPVYDGLLASSSTTVASTALPATRDWVTFEFDGSYTMTSGTPYFLVISTTNTVASGVLLDRSGTDTHVGQCARSAGGGFASWANITGQDMIFEVYTPPTTVVPYVSALLDNTAPSTNRLGAGTGSFTAGDVTEDGVANDQGWPQGNYTEHLYSITLKAADVADADTLRFRVLRNGATTGMTYTQVPTVNVTEAGGGATVNATVALTAASTLTVTGVRDQVATVALVAASALSTTGVPVREATVTLTAASTLIATGTVVGLQVATVALVAASTLTTTGVREQAATVALSATSTLTATGTVTGAATELEVVGTSKYEPTGTVSTVVLPVPGATALGDLIIAETQFNSATPMSLPSGWNEWHAISQTALGVYAFWRIATASEPADYTLTLPSTVRASGSLIVIRNADITTPEDVTSAHATANTTAQVAYPAITPITAGAWVLAIGAHVTGTGETTSVWSASNMTTDIYATSKSGAATNFTGAIAHAAWTSGAFTPNLTSTLTTARSTSISSVIRPVGAPPPTTVDATAALSASATLTTVGTLFHFTNSQRNSSFEAGRADWDTFGPAAIAFPTDTGQEITGYHVARLTATSAGVPQMRSTGVNRIPLGAPDYGQYLTVYGEFQWENGTPSDCRLDVQFMDPDGSTVVQTNTGSPFTPTVGSWTRIKNNDNLIPSGCAAARLRFVIVDAVAADSILVEDIYAFVGPDIPAGPAPDWAPHPSDIWEQPGAVSLSAVSTLTADGTVTSGTVQSATVALAAVSTLSATAVREPQAAVSLTGTSTLTVTGTAFHVLVATVALTGTSSLTATAVREPQAAASLTATSTLSATAVRTQPATAALTGVSTLTATGFEQAISAVALVGVSTLSVTAVIVGVQAATVALTAASTLTVTGVRGQAATSTLTAASTLTANAVRAPQASVGMTATSTLSVTAIRSAVPTVALVGTSTLTATGVRFGVHVTTVALTATSTLTANAVREPQAAVSLVAASTLTVTAIVDHFVNGQRNSSFEAGRTDWDTFGPAAITFPNDTGLALHGTHVGRLRATGAGTPMMRSTGVNRIPVAGGAGLYLNVYANFRWDTGTVKDCRMDVQFLEIDGSTVVQTNIGTLFTPSASAWTRILNNDNLIPVGAHEVRVRFVIPSAETNDALLVEDIYSHLGSNIHNDGPHPAWAPHPEDIWDQPAAVPLAATSTLTVTAVRFGVTQATVPLTATSTLTANAVREPQASVSLVAGSTLTATAVRTRPATVALAAASTLTATASVLGQVAATVALTAASTLTATGFRTPQASVSLVAGSTLTVTAIRSAVASVPLAAVGTLSAAAVRVPQASVSLTAASTLTVTAVRSQAATVALAAASTLSAAAVRVRPATVGLVGVSTLTATGTVAGANVVVATAALTAVSTLTATAVRVPQAAVSLTATSTLTVTAVKTRPATVSLTATSTLAVTSVTERPGAVPLTATSTLVAVAAAAAPVLATVALSATATLSVTAVRTPLASVSLTASFTLTATAVRTSPATVSLTASATLTVLAYEDVLGAVVLVGTSSLTAIGTITGLIIDRDLVVGPALPPMLVVGPAWGPVFVSAGALGPPVSAAPVAGSTRRYRSSTPRPPRYSTGGVP